MTPFRTLLGAAYFSLTAVLISLRADDAEYRLMEYLMRNYNKKVRPSLNHTFPLNVTFGLALAQIIDVDEKNQILTTNVWINQQWIDFNLRWDPGRFDGVSVVRIPANDIWKPDILLYNNNVIVTSGGNVTWLSMMIFKSSCSISVAFFPFDSQNCTMEFASWTYDGFQIDLVLAGEEGDASNYIPNSEWQLILLRQHREVKQFSCCPEPYPMIRYFVQIRRRPLFYMFNMMFPCMLITMIALLGFYVPAESGEKVTMGITTLLSMTVFLMMVADALPPTKDQLPLLGLYYGLTIAIVSFATVMTVLTLNVHHKGAVGQQVPYVVRVICFDLLGMPMCLRNEITDLRRKRQELLTPKKKQTAPSGNSGTYEHQYFTQHSNSTSPQAPTDVDFSTPGMPHSDTIEPLLPHNVERLACTNGTISPRFGRRMPFAGGSLEDQDYFEMQFLRTLRKIMNSIHMNECRQIGQDRAELIRQEWRLVALIIDRALLFLFVAITVTMTCVLLTSVPPYLSDDPHAAEELTSPPPKPPNVTSGLLL